MIGKFRVWDSREKKMWSPKEVEEKNWSLGSHGVVVALDEDSLKDGHLWNIDHFATPLFWTGLKDKNDVEIFQGDITYWKIGVHEETNIVEWAGSLAACSCCYESFNGSGFTGFSDAHEIIGNIFENPELLEVGK